MLKWILAAISWFLAYTVTLHAEQRALYSTASFLGRGGAMVADVDDYNALFVNPAGLSLMNEGLINMEIQLESSMGLNDFLTAYFGYNTQGKISSEDRLSVFRNQNDRARISALASYTKKDFGMALFTTATIDTDYSDQALPTADVYSATDLGMQMSFSSGFLEKEKLRIGSTGKMIFRMGKFGNMDFTALNQTGVAPFGQMTTYGVSLGADMGVQYTFFRDTYDVSIGASGLDLCTTFLTNKPDRPPSLSSRVVVGIGLKVPQLFKRTMLRVNLDFYKSVLITENVMDLLHFGVELKLPQFLSLRAGVNQMYWTAGVGVKYWLLEVDFATYTSNIWASIGDRKASDRRYMFQAKLYF